MDGLFTLLCLFLICILSSSSTILIIIFALLKQPDKQEYKKITLKSQKEIK